MPGTIHVSVLELVGFPSPPQSSAMGVKVSMGKQVHEMQDKEETSFPLASLRDNLNVLIHDAQGNEIARTDVETRSIVEKGTWDNLFPLKGGGNIHMRLHFNLTEDEQNRIRSMRESAARKKQEDLMKRSPSSSELAGASGGSSASSQDSLKSQHQTQERSSDPSVSKADTISAESNVKLLNKAHPGQKKQAFSSSQSTGTLDKMPAYQLLKERIQGQDAEQQTQLDKTPSNDESPANKPRATTPSSSSTTMDIPSKLPSLKNTVTVNTKPLLAKLETTPAPSMPKAIEKERRKLQPDTDETARLSSFTSVDTTSVVTSLKKTVAVSSKPVLPKLETSPAPSMPKEIEKERGKLLPVIDETARSNSDTSVDTSSLVPSLKKMIDIRTKPVLSKFKTAPSPSTPEEVGKESEKVLAPTNETREITQLSSNTRVDTSTINPSLKKSIGINTKPVLSRLKAAQSPSTPEKVGKEKGKVLFSTNETKETLPQISSNVRVETPPKEKEKLVAVNSETVLSYQEAAPVPYQEMSGEKNLSKTQPTKDENKEEKISKVHTSTLSESSTFSLKALLEALPKKKKLPTDKLFKEMHGVTSNDPFLIEKKWRSKRWKLSQNRANSKVFHGNEHSSIGSFRGWIFLDEMIYPCVLSDDRPFDSVDHVLEGCLSGSSPLLGEPDKITDTGATLKKNEKHSIGGKKSESSNRLNNTSFTGPTGQVMKITLMLGFGLLVIFTRQRK